MDEMLKALIEANQIDPADCEPSDKIKKLEEALNALLGGETDE